MSRACADTTQSRLATFPRGGSQAAPRGSSSSHSRLLRADLPLRDQPTPRRCLPFHRILQRYPRRRQTWSFEAADAGRRAQSADAGGDRARRDRKLRRAKAACRSTRRAEKHGETLGYGTLGRATVEANGWKTDALPSGIVQYPTAQGYPNLMIEAAYARRYGAGAS